MASLPPTLTPQQSLRRRVRSLTPTPPEGRHGEFTDRIGAGPGTVPHGAGTDAQSSEYNLMTLFDENSVRPEDSISNVKSNTSSTLSKLRYKNIQKEIEIKNELKALTVRTIIENEKRDLQARMEIENAEEEIRQASEKAARIRREQDLKIRLAEMDRREREILLQTQLKSAEEMNSIHVDYEVGFKPQYRVNVNNTLKTDDNYVNRSFINNSVVTPVPVTNVAVTAISAENIPTPVIVNHPLTVNSGMPVENTNPTPTDINNVNPLHVNTPVNPLHVNTPVNPNPIGLPIDNVLQPDGVTSILHRLIENQREQALPAQEIVPFDGTVLDFPTFITNFKYIVENNTSDEARRLELLIKYTVGEARELIKQCPMIQPVSEAYKKARYLLNRDYGNEFVLSAAFRSTAESWDKILTGDKLGLRKYSLFLNNCVNVQLSNDEMKSMDSSDSLNILASKLPVAHQQKWISKIGDFRESKRSPKLKDLEEFVGRISRNENDPRVQGLGYQLRSQQNRTTVNRGQSTLYYNSKPAQYSTSMSKPSQYSMSKPAHKVLATSTQVETEVNLAAQPPCLFCQGIHSLLSCRQFDRLSCDEKSDAVKKRGLCFACLNPKHMKINCTHDNWVKCNKCDRKHMTVMHDPKRDDPPLDSREQTKVKHIEKYITKPNMNFKSKISSGCVLANTNPLMAIAPVLVKHKSANDHVATYCFVDNGSAAGFSCSDLCSMLKVNGRVIDVTLKTLNSEQNLKTEIMENLQVGNLDGQFIDLSSIYVKDSLPVGVCDIPTNSDLEKWEHLRHIKLPDIKGYPNCIPRVTLMIGSNTPAATTPLEVCIGNIGEPYGIRSPLGWLLYGLPGKLSSYSQSISVNFVKLDENLEKQIKHYFEMEFAERLCDDKSCPSVEDKRFLKIMTDSIVLKNKHYSIDLPFRDRSVIMPNNKLQAETFAYSLKKRFMKNQLLHEQYSKFMKNLEDKNYSEVVPPSELDRDDGHVWYVSHHNVVQPKKPEKVRVVFNCPLLYQNFSLNNQLLQGPDLTNLLLGVLLRWREENFAIMGDIEQMFYQVRVSPRDCDMIRYLWWPDNDLNKQLTVYRMLVHPFGAVSSPSCANFALKQTAIDNMNDCSDQIINAINKDFYVDDLLKSLPNEQDCIDLIKEISEVLAKGGFHITKWVCNSKKVLASIPEQDLAEQVKDLDISTDSIPAQRALGVQWNIESDKIKFRQSDVNKSATRRNILSVISSIYDPFGITAPFVLKAKIILQNLCREKLSWDESIPPDCEKQWNDWLSEISDLDHLSINRCVKPQSFENIVDTQLHHFSDASQEGYGSVSYLRFENSNGDICVSFLIGRSRVAPIKPHTIVKLELAAATSIVRINNMLTREMNIKVNSVYFWSDSQTVLKYIHNVKSRYQVFVANRIAIIHDGSSVDQWKYVPGKLNPADIASRGASVKGLINNSMWLKGPEFLKLCASEWPENIVPIVSDNTIVDKLILPINVVQVDDSINTVNVLIEKYSNWNRLKRAISWWMRLKEILLCKCRNVPIPDNLCKKSLSVQEINNAEFEVVKFVQRSNYPEEVKFMNSKDQSVKLKSNISSLDPFIKDDVIRVGGRIRNATVSFDAKHQIILPKNSHVSTLIVRSSHAKVGHLGRDYTLAEIRKFYWIIKGGVLVDSILSKCVLCRKYKSHVCEQKMADLPSSRLVSDHPAFTHVGMDYFGPFEIKVGRSLKKRYGVIFSCFSSRAVHIEVSDTLDTSSCINAIRRF